MKQHITIRDLAELSEEELEKHKMAFYPPYFMLQQIEKRIVEPSGGVKKVEISDDGKLYIYFVEEGYFLALPSIGQMIEYLDRDLVVKKISEWSYRENTPQSQNLSDILWEEVKKTYK